MKKLFLLDGMALIYRAHFAFSKTPRITSYGLNTSAILGFTNTLLELLKKERPSHIAVVFDTQAPTERHTDFTGYKANREAMPEDLSKAIPYIFEVIEGFNIPVITSDGYEADDIIGTLSKQAEKQGYQVFCMTPDKDFAQLVSENIFLYKPARMGNDVEIMGVPEVLKKWEIEKVEQVIDILGLWGDAVDNIPGIPGIGEKTAKELIKRYGSMENIIANSHELKGKQKENVEQFAEQGLLSKKLATIILDAPVTFDESTYQLTDPDKDRLEPLLAKLEFRTLGQRIFGQSFQIQGGQAAAANQQTDLFGNAVASPAPSFKSTQALHASDKEMLDEEPTNFNTIANTAHTYHLVDSREKRRELISKLKLQPAICFDTETTGTDANQVELVGLSFAIDKAEAWYIPVPESQQDAQALVEEFREIWEDEKIEKIGQNIKYDILVLKWYGVEVKGKLFDTMLAHYLLDADGRHGMDVLAQSYLNYSPVSITELIGKKGKGQGSMRDVDLEAIKEYAAEDADITLQLKTVFEPQLDSLNARKLFDEVENPLIYVLADMEKEGINLDVPALQDYSKELESDIAQLEQEIYEKAGVKFNIASPKQLGEILFDKLQLDDKAKKTKTGQYKTDEDVLQVLAGKHDVPRLVLDFRQLSKLKSTYVDALPTMLNPRTGRVHTNYRQAVAATGRLSSDGPNLQNIPIKTEKGREVRKAFIPRDKDHVLISADYSQIELRIIAEISKDEGMMEAFLSGQDIHTATAAKVYGISLADVDSTMRRNAKAVNFGIIYGQSAFGLSQSLGIPRKEAAEIIENYFKQYPRIKQYMTDVVVEAKNKGYVETIMGRRRYLRDINSANMTVRGYAERNAINAPIQGSAADMIKVAMINLQRELKAGKYDTKMILQVHDELVFDAPKNEVEKVTPLIVDCMKNALKLEVPILVEAGTGMNWLEAH